MKEKDISSLEHTRWRCQYHVVFAPKYRRMTIYREIKADIGKILRKLCEQKGIEIIEAEAFPDHIHMLLSIPPKMSVSYAIGYLKGKSSQMPEKTAVGKPFGPSLGAASKMPFYGLVIVLD